MWLYITVRSLLGIRIRGGFYTGSEETQLRGVSILAGQMAGDEGASAGALLVQKYLLSWYKRTNADTEQKARIQGQQLLHQLLQRLQRALPARRGT